MQVCDLYLKQVGVIGFDKTSSLEPGVYIWIR